jgi:hypothetical protein
MYISSPRFRISSSGVINANVNDKLVWAALVDVKSDRGGESSELSGCRKIAYHTTHDLVVV